MKMNLGCALVFGLMLVTACDDNDNNNGTIQDGAVSLDVLKADSAPNDGHLSDGPIFKDAGIRPDSQIKKDASSQPIKSYTISTIASACADMSQATKLAIQPLIYITETQSLPFPFPFYGDIIKRIVVENFGKAFLFTNNSLDITVATEAQAIPSTEKPNGFLAPLWDAKINYYIGNNIEEPVSSVRVGSIGTGSGQKYVVEWNAFCVAFTIVPDPTSKITYQAQLYPNGVVEYHYCELTPGTDTTGRATGSQASIGLESLDGTKGVQFSFKKANAISTTKAIRFTPQY
jgi:hypothetical protein